MRSSSAVVLMIVLAALVFAQKDKEKAKDGFVPLFNGKDLKGWEFLNCSAKDWKVEDGVLSTVAGKGRGGNSWLLSEAFYDDFELRLEYQLATKGADSGVALRAASENPSGNGLDVQVVDDDAYPRYKAEWKNGALLNIAGPAKQAGKPVGQWNRLHVTLVGRKLKVLLNGVAVQDVDLDGLAKTNHAGLRRVSGHIGLQWHTGVVKFRDIHVKPLGRAAEPSPASEGRLTLTLDPGRYTSPPQRVFFDPNDDNRLITLADDRAVRLWDVAEGRSTHVFYPPGVPYTVAAALSKDGKRLAVPSRYFAKGRELHVVYVLSLPDGRIEKVVRGHAGPIVALAFSPDGKRLASFARWEEGIWMTDLEGDGRAKLLEGKRISVTRMAFAPDGKRLVYSYWLGKGAILDLESNKEVAKVEGHLVAWSADGKTVATAFNKILRLYDPEGKKLHEAALAGNCISLAFSGDSKKLLCLWDPGTHNNVGTLVDVASGKELKFQPRALAHGVCALSSDGALAVTAGGIASNDQILIWRTEDGQRLRRVTDAAWMPGGAAFVIPAWSKDGKGVCWCSWQRGAAAKNPMFGRATFRLEELEFAATLTKDQRHEPVFDKDDLKEKDGLTMKREGKAIVVSRDGKMVRRVFGGDAAAHLGKGLVASVRDAYGPYVGVVNALTGQGGRLSPDGRYFLQIRETNQTLLITPVEQTKPLLTLYRNGNDWVIWTEEGYYAATPGGELLMGWKVDNGIDQMPTVYAADRFQKKLHRPDVIKKAFELGSVKAALAALDGKGAKVEKVEDVLPPRASIRVVKENTKTGEYELEVTAEAQAKGQPVVALRLMLDGRPFPDLDPWEDDKGKPKAKTTWKVKIPEGIHTLDVLARSPDASSRSEAVVVRYLVAGKQPTLHLLAVGIDDYGKGIPKLRAAVNDAKDLAKAFGVVTKGDLFKECKVHTPLLNGKATRQAILDQLTALRESVKREDVVVVFFAGHGVRQDKEFYLLTADSKFDVEKKSFDPKTALSGKELATQLSKVRGQVLLLLDACHSGAMADSFRGGSDAAARGLGDDEVGVTVLAAAMGHQSAQEKGGNGFFTSAIKEALEGKPEVPAHNRRDGRLYVQHLYSHVMDRVSERTNNEQTPFLQLPARVPPFALRQFDVRK